MWMNSGLELIFELQIKPITKSDCSTAICSCTEKTFIGKQVILNDQPNGFVPDSVSAYRCVCVITAGQGPLGTHLCYQQTATAQGLSYGAQTLHHSGSRHHMGVHDMGPGWNLVQSTFILVFDSVSNVSKLAVFEDEEVVLVGQSLQFVADCCCVVLFAGESRHQPNKDDKPKTKEGFNKPLECRYGSWANRHSGPGCPPAGGAPRWMSHQQKHRGWIASPAWSSAASRPEDEHLQAITTLASRGFKTLHSIDQIYTKRWRVTHWTAWLGLHSSAASPFPRIASFQGLRNHSSPWHCRGRTRKALNVREGTSATLSWTCHVVPESVVVQNEVADVLCRLTVDALGLPQHIQQVEHGDDGMEPYSPRGQHLYSALHSVHYNDGVGHLRGFHTRK